MSNAFYDKGREGFATAQIGWVADTITAYLVDAADYTVNLATHDFLDDVPSGARVGSANLASKTATAGVLDADDTVLPSVTGDQSEYVILAKNTGSDATSRLIAIIDTATGLPATPTGTNVTIAWDNTAGVKIAKL